MARLKYKNSDGIDEIVDIVGSVILDNTQSGTTAARDAAFAADSTLRSWYNRDSGKLEYYDPADPTGGPYGNGWKHDVGTIDGAMAVTVDRSGPAHNRNLPAAQTTHDGTTSANRVEWTIAENVRQVGLMGMSNTAEPAQTDEMFLAVVNAPTPSIAKQWLEDSGAYNRDVQYEMGSLRKLLTVSRTQPITSIDVLPLGDPARFVFMGV